MFLNGVRQNNTPVTHILVKNMEPETYSLRIEFEDKAIPAIEKSVPVEMPGTRNPADVVYQLKQKKGEARLHMQSCEPAGQSAAVPGQVVVIDYVGPGRRAPTPAPAPNTAGRNEGNGNINIDVNAPAMNMTAPVQDGAVGITPIPNPTTPPTQNTETNEHQAPAPAACPYPMDMSSFKNAKQAIRSSTFEDTKLAAAKDILATNCLTTDQVVQICQLFGFEEARLDYAKAAYGRTTDPSNYNKVSNILNFNASKTDLSNYIATYGKNGGR